MNFSEYQSLAVRTAALHHDAWVARIVLALGLTGEAGETGELVKKAEAHGHGMDVGKLSSELGDVLWYLAVLASSYGLDLGDIAQGNIKKLRLRYPDGFSTDASIARVDQGEQR